jgi:7-dehydrocholesterol reductase
VRRRPATGLSDAEDKKLARVESSNTSYSIDHRVKTRPNHPATTICLLCFAVKRSLATFGMWSSSSSGASHGLFPSWIRQTVGPLLLICVTLPFPPVIAFACSDAGIGGSGRALVAALLRSPLGVISAALHYPTAGAVSALAAHTALQIALLRLLPGRRYSGPITAAGEVPEYVDNGLAAFFVTIAVFFGLSSWGVGGAVLPAALRYAPTIFYDEYVPLISMLSVGALGMCALLYVKGLVAPSSRDSGSSGNFVMDLFWGTELYPRIAGVDVKQLVNCRHGLMLWALMPLSFLAHAAERGTLSRAAVVNTALQLVYVCKFFVWEAGYMASMDIAHDRAGYYLCWGCAAFVPSMYLVHSWWLVNASARAGFADVSPGSAALIALAGLAAIALNYDADRQRQVVRSSGGTATVWGAKPRIIRAPYVTDSGLRKESILLASGWWGLSRHWHYVPEIAAALAWSLPAGSASALPYVYVAFLTVLLVDRAFRDDARCAAKYGAKWDAYRRLVPYKIVPGLL